MSVVLYIGMPTMGEIATPTVKSLIGLTQSLAQRRVPFAFDTYEFSDIVFSRNQLMSKFLTDERYTHMLCLDSDMAFEPSAIWRLIEFGADFAATAYPQKHPKWGRLRALIEAEAAKPEGERAEVATLLSRAWTWNHQLGGFDGKPWVPKRRGGFVTVPATGTGMMLLSRAVPERMTAAGVALRKPRMEQVPLHKGLKYHDFFSHLNAPDGSFMYGEDQSFCMRWTHHCGGEIWLDTESVVNHFGNKAHIGRYADQVEGDFPAFDDLD